MSAPLPPPLESLRRQLEGRWERIERARERYTHLMRQLSAFQWRSALRGQPELLKETREQEAELTEVLAYVEHRAQREQWPRKHPGLRVLQELRDLRAELDALAHERLARTPAQNGASLVEALGELEALALALPPRPPGEDDLVLFEDWMLSWPSPGRVWLTPHRLLWQPWFGDPIQLPLASLEPEAVTLLPGWSGVHLKRRGLTLFSLSYAETLASLLRLGVRTVHRAQEQPQANDVATSLAYRRHVDSVHPERWGLGVFGPHGAALLPARHRTLLDFCLSLVGIRARTPQPPELRQLESLVEHLRRLPPGDFDHALRELTRARGGRFWPSTGFHRIVGTGQEVIFQAGEQCLVVPQPQDTLHDLLWRHRPAGNSPSPERPPLPRFLQPLGRWWRKHKLKVTIAASIVLAYTSPLLEPWPPSLFPAAGYALFAWICMRYSRAKGYTVLPGLLASFFFPVLICYPVPLGFFLLMLMGGSKKKT